MRNNGELPTGSAWPASRETMSDQDPYHHFDDRAAGRAMLGTILFCLLVGAGVGVFYEQPVVGALIGGAAGIALGFWLVPRLLRDWQ